MLGKKLRFKKNKLNKKHYESWDIKKYIYCRIYSRGPTILRSIKKISYILNDLICDKVFLYLFSLEI